MANDEDFEHPTGMDEERLIVLHSADNFEFLVQEVVALKLPLLENKIINNPHHQPTIYISGTKWPTLAIVIKYCNFLAGLSGPARFYSYCNPQVDLVTLFNIIQAAHHLEIKSLMDLTCKILKYKINCKTIEIKKELINPDACVLRDPVAKRLKRDIGEDEFKSILRNPGRQTFIMIHDYEDVLYHRFFASELRCINRKNSYFDGYVQKIMMPRDTEELLVATEWVGQVMRGDRSSAESIEHTLVQRLLYILMNGDRRDIKHRAIVILGQASFDKCPGLMENKVIPLLVKFVSDDINSAAQALIALIRLACAFPHCIEFIIKNCVLEAVQTIVNSDRWVGDSISYSAKLLAVICRGYNLPTEKHASLALEISEAILQNRKNSYDDKARACYVLSYLSYKNQVPIKMETCEMLIDFIYCGDPMLAGSALGVVENIVRWGMDGHVEYFVKDTKLLRCLGKRMLCCGYEKFRKQACQLISNVAARGMISIKYMIEVHLIKPLCSLLKDEESDVQMEAAWALFNGINEYTPEEIDEYLIENGNCSEILRTKKIDEYLIENGNCSEILKTNNFGTQHWLLEPEEPEGWAGLSLMEVFRVVYLGEEEVMPNKQLGWIKIIPNDGRFQYLYNVQNVDDTLESIEELQDLNLTVKGPTISFSEVEFEFNLFCGTFKDREWLQWEPYPSDVLFKERRIASSDGTRLISIMMGLFGNATVANLEIKLKHYSSATTVYGLVVASNSKLDMPMARSMLFWKKHDSGKKLGNDGIIPLSKSRLGVPLGSILYVDISLHCDGQHYAYSVCFKALLNGETAEVVPSEENAEMQVTVNWDADEDSNYWACYNEDSNSLVSYDEDSKFSVYDENEDSNFSVSEEDSMDEELSEALPCPK